MAQKKSTKISRERRRIARRRALVSKFLHDGIENRDDIARILEREYGIKVTGRTVGQDKAQLEKEWKERAAETNDIRMARYEGRYELVYNEAVEAWFRSLEDAITETEETVLAGDAPEKDKKAKPGKSKEKHRTRISTTTRGQSGNAALLAQMRGALGDLRAMFGLDEAIGSGDTPFVVKVMQGDAKMEDL